MESSTAKMCPPQITNWHWMPQLSCYKWTLVLWSRSQLKDAKCQKANSWMDYGGGSSKNNLTQWVSHIMEFSLNGAELSLNSGNSENLRNHWSMNWVQYKDLLCYLCLCGLVVSSLSLTQEILGSSPTLPFLYFINFFCHWIQRTFRENSKEVSFEMPYDGHEKLSKCSKNLKCVRKKIQSSFRLKVYRLGTVKSKSFVGEVLLWIKWKFELHYTL